MEENNLSSSISAINQQPPEQSISSNQKPNYWKIGFFITLFMLVSFMGLLAYFIETNKSKELDNQSAKSVIPKEIPVAPSVATPQDVGSKISVKITPYRADDENGQIIVTFQLENLNKGSEIDKVSYWTDKSSACKAKTDQFTEFIKVPASEINTYVFFTFTDKKGSISEIYVSSDYPIFQCGKLAE